MTVNNSPLEPRIVFVVGFPRSGTTFLAAQLARFEGFAATPETRYFRELIDEKAVLGLQVSTRRLLSEVTHSRRLADLDIDFAAALAAGGNGTIDRLNGFRLLMGAFARKHQASIVVEKSPVHTYHVLQFLDWFPEARIVGIQRDGRDALLSLRRTIWATKSDRYYAADWIFRNRLIEKAKERAPDRVRIVRFEDVVSDGGATVADLADWILPGVVAAPEGVIVGDASVPAWEKPWKGNVRAATDASRAGAWQSSPDHPAVRRFESVAGPALAERGYDGRQDTLGGRLFRLAFRLRLFAEASKRRMVAAAGLSSRISSQSRLTRLVGEGNKSFPGNRE